MFLRQRRSVVVPLLTFVVLALVRVRTRARASGIELDERWAHLWTARNGLAVRLQVFSNVAQFPVRVKCASMPWHTLKAALAGGDAPELVELK